MIHPELLPETTFHRTTLGLTRPVGCWCGRGCTGSPSVTDAAVHGERDAMAKALYIHGEVAITPYVVVHTMAEVAAHPARAKTRRKRWAG